MKQLLHLLLIMVLTFSLKGQTNIAFEKGTVTYVSSRNVYVKFASTENINLGDTLYFKQKGELIPALIVQNKSSTSSVCTPIISEKFKVSDEIQARVIVKEEKAKAKEEKEEEPPDAGEKIIVEEGATAELENAPEAVTFKQKIKGRISVASYSNLSDYQNTNRMQYAFAFRGNNLGNSKFSTETYITFRHTLGEWDVVQENINNALKVYALSVRYDFDRSTNLTLGRKINPKIASIGAIDGLQFEKGFGQFLLGAVVGSRPDFSDYSLNLNLLQAGAFAGFVSGNPNKYQQGTIGFMEQRNGSNVDRRFVYFQYSGDLLKNLNLFSSFELDLYQKINDEVKNSPDLTNLYLSLRYRLSKNWKFSLAYDNRKNIIYYESYKSYIDQLIDDVTRQGLRFNINYRITKNISWGVNSSWRFQKNDENTSRNLNSFVSFSRIPFLKMSANIRANFLQTDYLDSRIFGARLSKEIIRSRLNGEVYYSSVDYTYKSSKFSTHQNILGINFSLKLMKKLTFYLYWEGTFDDQDQQYQRINTRIIQRF